MATSSAQVDNLVNLLDGYATKGGHHLNVNVRRNLLSDILSYSITESLKISKKTEKIKEP